MTKRNRSIFFPIKKIQDLLIESLGNAVICTSDTSEKPLIITVRKPSIRKYRIYIFNCGNPPGGRAIDEYKIVLNVGQEYGQNGNFDYSDECFAIVVGYVNQLDIFVLWDASKHKDFSYNKNMQVRAETIINALAYPLSFQKRRTKNGIETIIAVRSKFLLNALNMRMDILYEDLING